MSFSIRRTALLTSVRGWRLYMRFTNKSTRAGVCASSDSIHTRISKMGPLKSQQTKRGSLASKSAWRMFPKHTSKLHICFIATSVVSLPSPSIRIIPCENTSGPCGQRNCQSLRRCDRVRYQCELPMKISPGVFGNSYCPRKQA